ncbi:MAG: lytic transglycosylase domain-containing protein [Acidobacteriota bacterium]
MAAPLDSAAPLQVTLPPSGQQLATDLALEGWLVTSWNSRIALHSSEGFRGPSQSAVTDAFQVFPRPRVTVTSPLRSVPFGSAIHQAAQRYRLDSSLVAAIVEVESGFDARVVSSAGALGLMQVMPDIAGEHGGDPFDPAVNLDVGTRYFSQLLRQFGGDVQLALAAYNAGPTTVERYGKVPPYRETRAFVRKVLTIYERRNQGSAPAMIVAENSLAR